ncbi:MAG: PLP-dependent aminotransferase family protein [Dehalococcoidia bacterium]|nr:PLP-dependent aminotransferase family protein [Dehalococcoidia bacterium]
MTAAPAPDYDRFLVHPYPGPPRNPKEDWKYNFGTVLPGVDLLPLPLLAESAKQAILEEGHLLSYYPPDQGPEPARQFIARRMKLDREIDVTAEELLLTNGSNEAIRTVLDTLIAPGDVIVTEQNLYLGSLRNFRQWGAEVVGVATDANGMQPEALEATLADLQRQGKRPKFIYTIPTFQNPEGTVLAANRRKAMLALAQRFDTLIFEDDCYVHENIDAEVPPAIASLPGAKEWVMYCATFSKILGPGVRLGWMTAPQRLLDTFSTRKVSGGNNFLVPMIVCRYLEQHWDARVQELKGILKGRRDAMIGALDEHFGEQVTLVTPRGGMFLWAALPEGVDTLALMNKVSAAGVRYNPGTQFSPAGAAKNYIRLAFAFCDERTIREGIGELARVLYREGVLRRM